MSVFELLKASLRFCETDFFSLWCFLRTRVSSVALILCDRFRSAGVLSIALVISDKRYTEGVCCQLAVASSLVFFTYSG